MITTAITIITRPYKHILLLLCRPRPTTRSPYHHDRLASGLVMICYDGSSTPARLATLASSKSILIHYYTMHHIRHYCDARIILIRLTTNAASSLHQSVVGLMQRCSVLAALCISRMSSRIQFAQSQQQYSSTTSTSYSYHSYQLLLYIHMQMYYSQPMAYHILPLYSYLQSTHIQQQQLRTSSVNNIVLEK